MKDSYYFKHDSNAKDDPKCVMLIEQLGLEGYGIFWVLIETLRDQPGYHYPVQLIPALARRFNTSVAKMENVITKYNLFEVENDKFFYSKSLVHRMGEWAEYKEKKSLAGRKGMQNRWQKALQSDNTVITNENSVITKKGEEKKREEKKGKERIREEIEPTQIEIFLKENRIFSSETFEFLNSEQFFEIKCMQLVTDYAGLFEKAKEFLIDIRDRDMIEGKSLEDMRSHFISWYKLKSVEKPKHENRFEVQYPKVIPV